MEGGRGTRRGPGRGGQTRRRTETPSGEGRSKEEGKRDIARGGEVQPGRPTRLLCPGKAARAPATSPDLLEKVASRSGDRGRPACGSSVGVAPRAAACRGRSREVRKQGRTCLRDLDRGRPGSCGFVGVSFASGESSGLSRAKLSALCGVADSTIRNCETGRHRPRTYTLRRLRAVTVLGIESSETVGNG